MNIEFHYYITYLISTRARYSPSIAHIIAHACQFTDDNSIIYDIGGYKNFISQTKNILKPREDLLRIYPLFHFIPGNILDDIGFRKDGKLHRLNTIPDSKNVRNIFNFFKNSGNPYLLGIACHSFADTYAHQNFVGYYESYNSMSGVLEELTPSIGHADARTKPDEVGLIWEDPRLIQEERDNNKIFLEAVESLYIKMGGKTSSLDSLLTDIAAMLSYNTREERISYANFLAGHIEYGGEQLQEYKEDAWLKECSCFRFFKRIPLENFTQSNWYNFQEAVKYYQYIVWNMLKTLVFDKMDLKSL